MRAERIGEFQLLVQRVDRDDLPRAAGLRAEQGGEPDAAQPDSMETGRVCA
jgi:hypothetical protein